MKNTINGFEVGDHFRGKREAFMPYKVVRDSPTLSHLIAEKTGTIVSVKNAQEVEVELDSNHPNFLINVPVSCDMLIPTPRHIRVWKDERVAEGDIVRIRTLEELGESGLRVPPTAANYRRYENRVGRIQSIHQYSIILNIPVEVMYLFHWSQLERVPVRALNF